jgi:hypothetical protein
VLTLEDHTYSPSVERTMLTLEDHAYTRGPYLQSICREDHACCVVEENADAAVRELEAKAVLVGVVDPLGDPQRLGVGHRRRRRVYPARHHHTASTIIHDHLGQTNLSKAPIASVKVNQGCT